MGVLILQGVLMVLVVYSVFGVLIPWEFSWLFFFKDSFVLPEFLFFRSCFPGGSIPSGVPFLLGVLH